MNRTIGFISILLLLYACGGSKKATREVKDLNEIVVTSASNEYRATEPQYWDIVHTDISLAPFQKAGDSFLKEAKGEISISLHPYFYASDSLALDAKDMDIDTVFLRKPFSATLNYQYEEDKLILHFDRKFHHADTIELFIKYTAKPYAEEAGGSSAISEDRGLYYINNNYEIPGKPKQIWTQGETQANSHWFPTLDQPNEKFTFSVSLLVPDSLTTLSNGRLVSSTKTDKGRMDKWVMEQPVQTYAVMFAIGKFAVVNDKEWKGKDINYYVEPEYAPYAKLMFKNTPEMVDYFSTVTGVNYPWNKYSQVVVRDYVSGAMENTSASLFGEFMNQNARENADKDYEDIVSHELFHQWFGDYVTAESWSHLTLNESFATYGEQLWRAYKYGRLSADVLAANDLNTYLQQAENQDPSLVRFFYHAREDMFDRVSYQKGASVLRYLHGLMGDSAFYNAMNIYLTTHAYENAEASDWRKAVEKATGTDWNWFFNQWYYRGGHPELRMNYVYDDARQQLQVTVAQKQPDSSFTYKLPLKAILVYGDTKEEMEWNIQKRRQTFIYPYKNGIKPLFIPDTKHWLVGAIKESKTTAQWLTQLRASEGDYLSQRRSVAAAYYEQKDTVSQTIFTNALKSKSSEIREYTLSLLANMPDKYGWQSRFKNEVEMMAMNDGNNKVRANAYNIIGVWKINSMKEEAVKAVYDSSYTVAGAALEALSQLDSSLAYTKAKEMAATDPKAELQDAVWLQIAKAGKTDDLPLLQQMADVVYGRRKISLAGTIFLYSIRTKDDAGFEKGMKLITDMAQTESIGGYRYSVGSLVFNAYSYYHQLSGSKKNEEAALAKRRMQAVEKYKQEILSAEKDSGNIWRYRQL